MKLSTPRRSLFNRVSLILFTLLWVTVVGIIGLVIGRGIHEMPTEAKTVNSSSDYILVTRVIDGDTIELEDGRRVRYIGIDAPETVHPQKGVECYGPEASERNRELVEGKVVELISELEDKDQYDRLLRYVFVDEVFVNAELIVEGYAYSASYGSNHRFRQLFVQLEEYSRLTRRGLWNVCP